MTLLEAHERAMRAYVTARVLEGWLPEGAARDAIETWCVSGGVPQRPGLFERLEAAGIAAQRGEDS